MATKSVLYDPTAGHTSNNQRMRVKIQVPEKPPRPTHPVQQSSSPSSSPEPPPSDDDDDNLSDTYTFISNPSEEDVDSPGPTTPPASDPHAPNPLVDLGNTEPPKTFADILPSTLITTSSISETGYYKNRFGTKGKKTQRRSTLGDSGTLPREARMGAQPIAGLPNAEPHPYSHSNADQLADNAHRRQHSRSTTDDEDFDSPWAPSGASVALERMRANDKQSKYNPKSYSPPSNQTKFGTPTRRGSAHGYGHAKSASHSSTFSVASSSSNRGNNSKVKEMMSSLRRSITKGGSGKGEIDRSYRKKRAELPKGEDYGRGEGASVFGTLTKSGYTGVGGAGGLGKDGQGYQALSD